MLALKSRDFSLAQEITIFWDEDDIPYEKKLQKLERKKFKKDHEVVMDEFLPKAGREAMLEKKALCREQARICEDTPYSLP
jgi:hypothetical protein